VASAWMLQRKVIRRSNQISNEDEVKKDEETRPGLSARATKINHATPSDPNDEIAVNVFNPSTQENEQFLTLNLTARNTIRGYDSRGIVADERDSGPLRRITVVSGSFRRQFSKKVRNSEGSIIGPPLVKDLDISKGSLHGPADDIQPFEDCPRNSKATTKHPQPEDKSISDDLQASKSKPSIESLKSLPILIDEIQEDLEAQPQNRNSVHTSTELLSENIPEPLQENRPFVPIPLAVKHGYFRIGSLTTDWASFFIAVSIILLFTIIPDTPKWTTTYYDMSLTVFTIRVFTAPAICSVFDAIALWIEARILGIDYEASVREARVSRISATTFFYFSASVCCTAGAFIVADTGYIFKSATYIDGRKAWS
ncbi:hypothetical protein HDU67_008172, partial [Dinochytrium kinnereticum]